MWRPYSEHYPWIEVAQERAGLAMHCLRTGDAIVARSELDVRKFVAAHSAAPHHGGLGDAVRAITKKLGFGECAPCAKRQAALNRTFPRVFRR